MLEHYLIFPVVLALWSGFTRMGTREFVEPAGHLYYWLVTAIPSWWCYSLASWGLAWALRPWRPPLWVVLAGGYFIGYVFLWTPMMPLRNAVMAPMFVSQPPSVFLESPEWPFFHIVGQIVSGVLPWLLLNIVHHVAMGVPKFGYAPPLVIRTPFSARAPAAAPMAAPSLHNALVAAVGERFEGAKARGIEDANDREPLPARLPKSHLPETAADLQAEMSPLLARCGLPPGTRLLALTAQEHYTRVATSAGSKLLLLRFSDAVRETMPVAGLQVHRSRWVAVDAVVSFERNGREGQLMLCNGETVPVSRSYVRALQAVLRTESQAA